MYGYSKWITGNDGENSTLSLILISFWRKFIGIQITYHRCVKFSSKDVCINSLILLFRRVRESFFGNDEWGIKTFVVHITKQMNSISQQNKIGSKHPLKKNKQGPCLVKTQDTSSQLLQTKPCTHKRENFFCLLHIHS